MKPYIIFALTGDYSKVAEEIEKELKEEPRQASGKIIDKIPVNNLRALAEKLSEDNAAKDRAIALMETEINNLYLKYSTMCAAFGEMNHFIQEASMVPERHSIES